MVVVRGVRWKTAVGVLKDRLVCASLMGVDGIASTTNVKRVRKGAPCSARHMVEANVAYLLGAPKGRKGVHRCARDMVVESVAFLVVGFAQRVFMEARTFVLLMVVERDVQRQAAQRVHVAALIVVSSMVEGSGASLKTVGRVPKGVQISARLMAGANDVLGERENVRNLQGVRAVFVLLTVARSWSGRQTREA